MISYDNINRFELLEPNKVLFFDIFCRNNEVILICPIYGLNKYKIDYDEIKILHDNNYLVLKSKVVKCEYEPIVILIYSIKSSENNIILEVQYKEQENIYKLKNATINKTFFLTQTTLFKNDFYLIPIFYKWYIEQGVEHFYLYYNGKIDSNLWTICEKYKNITLIQWDYIYHNTEYEQPFLHHAQLGQINHALYKYGKVSCQWMISNDLDEYMYIPNQNILNVINEISTNNNHITSIGFLNYWASAFDNSIPDKIPETILITDYCSFHHQSKCIHKTDEHQCLSIHHPGCIDFNKLFLSEGLMLIHFENWSGGNRNHPKSFKLNITPKKL